MSNKAKLPLAAAALGAILLGLPLASCSESEADLPPIDQARHAITINDGLGAELILREMLEQGAAPEEINAYLAEAEMLQGNGREARELLQGGHFDDATRAYGYRMLGRLEMNQGNLPAAGQAFDKSIAADSNSAELWVDIGRLRYRGGEQAQALDASIHALELEPENTQALLFRAQLVRDSDGMQAAIEWFEEALKKNPENVDLMIDYAATLGELGRAKDMLRILRQVATLDRSNSKIYYLQAVLAARAGNFDLAQSLMQKISRADRALPATMLLSGIIDIEKGNYASASQTLFALHTRQPSNRRVRQMLARALSLGHKETELIYRFGTFVNSDKSSAYLQTLVARAYESVGRREEAGQLLDKATVPRLDNFTAVESGVTLELAQARGTKRGMDALALVRAHIQSGNPQAAVRAANALLKDSPGSSDVMALAADANFAANQLDSAIARYQDAANIRRPWRIARKIIRALMVSGRTEDARQILAKHFVGEPSNVEAAIMLSRDSATQQDWETAALFADHALINGAVRDPTVLAYRAEIALQMDDADTAFSYAETAYSIQPLSKITTQMLLRCYELAGDYPEQTEQMRRKMARIS